MNKSILITGCSSGFGRLTAMHLAQAGWLVLATVRSETDRESLLAEAKTLNVSLSVFLCDITDREQVARLREEALLLLQTTYATDKPPLHALLNNAGTAFGGPIELVSLDDVRAQMEINVIAHIAVTQAFLPVLKQGQGTIINVSSVAGRITMPMLGLYSASKYALEAISDALRLEVAPFGVKVVIIEPASSPTSIWNTSIARSFANLEEQGKGQYERLFQRIERIARRFTTTGFPPHIFVTTVDKILNSKRPRLRYPIPGSTHWLLFCKRFLSDRALDRSIRKVVRW